MSNNTTTVNKPLIIFAVMAGVFVTAFVFVVAMTAGVGMMILLVLCVAALSVIALWFSRGVTATGLAIADKRLAANAEQHRHVEAVIKLGYSPHDYAPVERQLATTAQGAPMAQLPSAKGIQFDSASMEANAINLLLYSCQLLGRESKRIASNPECAAANIPGYNGRKWDAIINKHLKLTYEIATVPGPVDNGGGAFVPPEIGTVGAFYDTLVYKNSKQTLDGAVNALPDTGRGR